MRTIGTLVITLCVFLSDYLAGAAAADGAEGPERSAKLRGARVTMAICEPMEAVNLLSFLALKLKCDLVIQVTETQGNMRPATNSSLGTGLNVVVTNRGNSVCLMLDVTNAPAVDLLDAIARKAGWKWDLSKDGIVVNVFNGESPCIRIEPIRPDIHRLDPPFTERHEGVGACTYEVARLSDRLAAMEHEVKAVRSQFDSVSGALMEYLPVQVVSMEGDAGTNGVPNHPAHAPGEPALGR